jgi:hypothetical protein
MTFCEPVALQVCTVLGTIAYQLGFPVTCVPDSPR